MTIADDFRILAAELAVDLMFPARLVRSVKTYDEVTRKSSLHESVTPCRAAIGARRVKDENGILTNQTMATLTIKPNAGDRLEIGNNQYTIGVVEEIAPDGKAVIWTAVAQ